MKKILFGLGIIAVMAGMTSCDPKEFDDYDLGGLPSASAIAAADLDFNRLDSNWVELKLKNHAGNVPVWYLNDGKKIISGNGVKYQWPLEGTYNCSVRLANQNGVSTDGYDFQLTFTERYLSREWVILSNGNVRTWRIPQEVEGHFGCGENESNPAGWWAAGVDEKVGTGMYDDRFTFNVDGTYTYSPGPDGLVYCNKGVSKFGGKNDNDDYDAETKEITGTWSIEEKDGKKTIALSSNAILGYVADDAQLNSPKFVIKKADENQFILVWNGTGISWQYIIASDEPLTASVGEAEPEPEEPKHTTTTSEDLTNFTPNGAAIDIDWSPAIYHGDENWGAMDDFSVDKTENGYKIHFNNATDGQWKAQIRLISQYLTTKDQVYEARVKIKASKAISQATLKISNVDESISFINNGEGVRFDLEAGVEKEYAVRFSADEDMTITEKDGNKGGFVILVDVGGHPEDIDVEIYDVLVQKAE